MLIGQGRVWMKEKKVEENQILKKNVAAIHICNVPLIQRKLHNVLMYLAVRSKPETNQPPEYCVSMPVLIGLLGYKSKDIAYLKSNLINLSRNNVEWNLFNDNHKEIEWGTASLLASARIRGGHCYFSFPLPLERMLRNPELYAKIDLQIQRRFSSRYALALYENVIRFVNLGCTRWIKVTLLKRILGIEEEETSLEFKYLNRLLKKAIDSVNDESDLFIEVEYRREARRITAVRFLVRFKENGVSPLPDPELVSEVMADETSIKERPAESLSLLEQAEAVPGHAHPLGVTNAQARGLGENHTESSDNDLIDHLCKYLGFDCQEAEKLLAEYDTNFILEHLDKVEMKYRQGEIRFVRPYLISTLQKATAARKALIEQECQNREQEERQRQKEAKLARKSEENRKQLEREYLDYRAKTLESVMQTLNGEFIEELDHSFSESIAGTPHGTTFRRRGFESTMIRRLYDNFLVDHLVEAHPQLSRNYFELYIAAESVVSETSERGIRSK